MWKPIGQVGEDVGNTLVRLGDCCILLLEVEFQDHWFDLRFLFGWLILMVPGWFEMYVI